MSIQAFSSAKAELKDIGPRTFQEDHFLRSLLHTHTQSGHASWHCNYDGKCEREFVRTKVES